MDKKEIEVFKVYRLSKAKIINDVAYPEGQLVQVRRTDGDGYRVALPAGRGETTVTADELMKLT